MPTTHRLPLRITPLVAVLILEIALAATAAAQCAWNATNTVLSTDCNVGIDTTTPVGQLHVDGSIRGRRFVDHDNPQRFADPSGLSRLNVIRTSLVQDLQLPSYFLDPASTGRSLIVAGKVGIGTTTPQQSLHVEGRGRFGGGNGWLVLGHDSANATFDNYGDGNLLINWYGSGNVSIGTRDGNRKNLSVGNRLFVHGSDLVLGTHDGRDQGSRPLQRALVHGGPSVGAKFEDTLFVNYGADFEGGIHLSGPRTIVGGRHIATGSHTDYRLAVDGKLVAREIVVTNGSEWADYVFEEDYPLMPLDELGRFIEEHGHLPGIPTTAEVERDGFEIAQTTGRLLAKIEELTLHTIAQERTLDEQRATLDAQGRQIERLLAILEHSIER